MRNTILSLLIVVVGSLAMSQATKPAKIANTFIPQTLSAGTLMSARSVTSAYDDTTKYFRTRGFSKVYVGLETSANDSVRVLLSYAPTYDGVAFDAYVTAFDSLTTTGTVGKIKYVELPANAMGAYGVRLRVYANTDVLRYSDSPTTKLTTKIIQVDN